MDISTIIFVISCLVSGIFAGVSSGLLGLGGGLVIVPVLNYLLPIIYPILYKSPVLLPICICTSFAVIILNTSMSSYRQNKANNVDWKAVALVVPFLILSSQIIGHFVPRLNAGYLKIFFGLVLFYSAIKMFLGSKKVVEVEGQVPHIKKGRGIAVGVIVGAISATAGISGGSLLGPYFNQAEKFSIKRSLGTSSACGVFLAASGFISYLISGLTNDSVMQLTSQIPMTFGYFQIVAFLSFIATSIIGASWGVKLQHILNPVIVKKIFAVFMVFVCIDMWYSAYESIFHI